MAYRKRFGSRQNYNSRSKLKYRDYQSDEATGKCKCLLKNRREIWLCGDKTRKREFHYCWDCYEMISSEDGRKATTTWPPKRDGKESRYCYDVDTENVFLIPDRWMEEYVDLAKSTGSAIDVKTRSFHSKKDGGDYPCWVYVLRLKDAMLYIGETRNLKRRIYQHKKNPSKTLKKHGGYKHQIDSVKVANRQTAEALEEFLVTIFRECGTRATNGFQDDD